MIQEPSAKIDTGFQDGRDNVNRIFPGLPTFLTMRLIDVF